MLCQLLQLNARMVEKLMFRSDYEYKFIIINIFLHQLIAPDNSLHNGNIKLTSLDFSLDGSRIIYNDTDIHIRNLILQALYHRRQQPCPDRDAPSHPDHITG